MLKISTYIGYFLWCLTTTVQGQDFTMTKKIEIDNPTLITTDENHIYVATENNEIIKYNAEGEELYRFSPPLKAEITLVEVWNGLKIFVFYQDLQEFIFLNRFLVLQQRLDITHDKNTFIRMATLSSDNNLWLLDETSFSLKKINVVTKDEVMSTPCPFLWNSGTQDICYIKEYRNQLYIFDREQGVFVFNHLGNYIKKYNIKMFQGIFKDEMYFINAEKNELIYKNIYNDKERVQQLPVKEFNHLIINEGRAIFQTKNSILLYNMK